MAKFSLEFTKRPKGFWGATSGFILEGDIRIGSFKRKAPQGPACNPIHYKFFSERAEQRFFDITGELTISETIGAMFPLDPI
jgi:hypothetical protein